MGRGALVLGLLTLAWSSMGQAAERAMDPRASRALRAMEERAGGALKVSRSPLSGLATFVSAPAGGSIPVREAGATPAERALSFLAEYGAAFGLLDRAQFEVERTPPTDEVGMDHVRIRQVQEGVPVTAGELVVHLRGSGVVAVGGKTVADAVKVSTRPTFAAERALERARGFLARRHGAGDAKLSEPRLEILNRGMLEGRNTPTRLAWFVEATGSAFRRFLWVDARSGAILLDFSQLARAKSREVYSTNSVPGASLPGTLVRSEGEAATGDADVDKAYDYAGATYDYFSTQHGRDSFDGAGAALVQTVHFCPLSGSCPFVDAFWNGSQLVHGEDFPLSVDVVAHEISHGVTEHTANLFDYMQSGALNESFSDIFGESVDLTNNPTEPDPPLGNRWLIGENSPLGVIRNMKNPPDTNGDGTPEANGHPEDMSDAGRFWCAEGDNGGVHVNSGVPNHAFALMVDGGTFNSITVTGIGLIKAGKIQYRTLAQYLVSGSDFRDNDDALRQSCADLIGTAGIAAADCTEVGDALDAVQMADPWPCANPTQPAVPARCPSGEVPTFLFDDTLESVASGNWSQATLAGCSGAPFNHWSGGDGAAPADVYWPFFATSGIYSFWGFNLDFICDSAVAMSSSVTLPAGARMQFNHSYDFESSDTELTSFDGGVVEYSTNAGGSWTDAGSLISAGAAYGGAISSCCSNPLAGRPAFVSRSWGYTASQLDLSTLNGQSVRFRFRLGTDDFIGDDGWFVDDVRIYTCSFPTVSVDDVAVVEGTGVNPTAQVTARLSQVPDVPETVTIDFSTADNTASAPADYTAVAGGTITIAAGEGSGTGSVTVVADAVNEGNESFFVNLTGVPTANATLSDPQALVAIMDDEPADFFTLTPCRVADTRSTAPPKLTAGTVRRFTTAGQCGIPADAKAVAINMTVVEETGQGHLRIGPAGTAMPASSTINFTANVVRANNAIVPLGADGKIDVWCNMGAGSTGSTQFLFDVSGYFR